MKTKFGGAVLSHNVEGEIQPLKKRVIVKNMHFGETKTKGGIIMLDDDAKESGIHPRWAQVHSVGPQQDDVEPGEWVLVAHGRWTRTFTLQNTQEGKFDCRMIDEDDILLVSKEEPGEANTTRAGYINTGGMAQAPVPGEN